ncbi:MarR family transcriptional regulator [Maricaulis sp.]|uniref:MarR family winged helix-turn-helix transcriptional regulator n=1 Tax=Maricaulis sp. TaxID=1486257 RepID=UPI0025C12F72|nr:MarR family transcriptional regulator [Maricaulis sp.]
MLSERQAGLDNLIHDEMAPGFLGLLLGSLVERLVEDGSEPAQAAGITAPLRSFSMLLLLSRADQSVTELARRLGVTHAAVIKTSRVLERSGLVCRGEDPDDARRKPLCLTPAGRTQSLRIEAYMQRANAVYADLFAEIGVDLFAAARAFEAALIKESFGHRLSRTEMP